MDPTVKDELLNQFNAFLEQMDEAPAMARDEDAFSLVAELAGLKTEIKREARQVKEAVEQFKTLYSALQADNDTLRQELEQRRAAEQNQRRDLLRPLLLQLLELRDRLEAGLALDIPRTGWPCRRHGQRLEALREGQSMSLRRLDRILADHRVRPMETLGKPLDPHVMRAVEVETRPDQAPGVVTGELRKGFWWDDDLLRTAEVKVNKKVDNKDN